MIIMRLRSTSDTHHPSPLWEGASLFLSHWRILFYYIYCRDARRQHVLQKGALRNSLLTIYNTPVKQRAHKSDCVVDSETQREEEERRNLTDSVIHSVRVLVVVAGDKSLCWVLFHVSVCAGASLVIYGTHDAACATVLLPKTHHLLHITKANNLQWVAAWVAYVHFTNTALFVTKMVFWRRPFLFVGEFKVPFSRRSNSMQLREIITVYSVTQKLTLRELEVYYFIFKLWWKPIWKKWARINRS